MQKLQPVKALIIDLDGTLADTAPDFVVAINQVRAELGLAPMHSDAVMRMVGKGAEHLILSMLKLEYPEDQANARHAASCSVKALMPRSMPGRLIPLRERNSPPVITLHITSGASIF